MMAVLTIAMLASGGVAVLLALACCRRLGLGLLATEVVMVAAMVDVHASFLPAVPPMLWAVLLTGCAIATALASRVRRSRSDATGSDLLHPVGLLLAAVLVVAVGAAGMAPVGASGVAAGVGVAAGAGTMHHHGSVLAAPQLVVAVALALAVYAVHVARTTVALAGQRTEIVRRSASLACLVLMGVMAVAGIIA